MLNIFHRISLSCKSIVIFFISGNLQFYWCDREIIYLFYHSLPELVPKGKLRRNASKKKRFSAPRFPRRVSPRLTAFLRVSPRFAAFLRVSPRLSAFLRVSPRLSASVRVSPRLSASLRVSPRYTAGRLRLSYASYLRNPNVISGL